MIHRGLLVTVGTLMLGVTTMGSAAAPPLIAYQGALTDAAGKPANGTFSVTLSMYESPAGGSPVWTEALTGIPVSNGVFSVILGASSPIPMGLANCNFLQVAVDGKPMLPRQRLLSVPYALEAQNAQTLGGEPAQAFHDASNLTAGTIPKERLPGDLQGDMPQLVGTADIADGAVTGPKIADQAVTGDKIKPGATVSGGSGTPIAFSATSTNSSDNTTALFGSARASTGATSGVRGQTNSPDPNACGVLGFAKSGQSSGVRGRTASSTDGTAGVYGVAEAGSGVTSGVVGETKSATAGASGVRGLASATTGAVSGVQGTTNSASAEASGVLGMAEATQGAVYGVSGYTRSKNGTAAGVIGKALAGDASGVYGITSSGGGGATGVLGMASATSGATSGVYGGTKSNAFEAFGVCGQNMGTEGKGVGVRGDVTKGLAGVMGYAERQGHGVWGATASTASGAAGVYGFGAATTSANLGVYGLTQSSKGIGVRGEANSFTGQTIGVRGVSASLNGVGVLGEAPGGGTGVATGVKGVADNGIGVQGEGHTGMVALTEVADGIALRADAIHVDGITTALHATVTSPNGTAILAEAPSGGYGYALNVEGKSRLNGDLETSGIGCSSLETTSHIKCGGSANFTGDIVVNGYAYLRGGHPGYPGDVAEHLRAWEVEAGDVVVIAADGKLAKCNQEADTAVAGIVSTDPTVCVGSLQAAGGTAPLALVGVVPCKVDASKAPIKPGDLLVSSSTPGHAMKCPNDRPKAGTVIGKALEGLDKGTGIIQVLVTLR